MNRLPKLIYMANQIATAFRQEGTEQAARSTCSHLRNFWDPAMRQMIAGHMQGGGAGLNDIARLAVAQLPESLPAEQDAR